MSFTPVDAGGFETGSGAENDNSAATSYDADTAPGHNGGLEGTLWANINRTPIPTKSVTYSDRMIFASVFKAMNFPPDPKFLTPFSVDSASNVPFHIQTDSTGEVFYVDANAVRSAGSGFSITEGVPYYFKTRAKLAVAGELSVWIVEENGTETQLWNNEAGDFHIGSGDIHVVMDSSAVDAENIKFWNYLFGNASDSNDDLPHAFEPLYYTGPQLANQNPHTGDILDTWQWNACYSFPFATTTRPATYSTTNRIGDCDSRTGASSHSPGPVSDSRVDGSRADGNLLLFAKYVFDVENSAFTSCRIRHGRTGAGGGVDVTNFGFTSLTGISVISTSTSRVPDSDEEFRLGFGSSTSAAATAKMHNSCGILVHIPDVVVATGRVMSSMAGAGGLAGPGGIAGIGGGLAG